MTVNPCQLTRPEQEKPHRLSVEFSARGGARANPRWHQEGHQEGHPERRRARLSERRRGFTLIELMITVAVVAILASVAIPSFLRYQMKARRSEVFINMRGVATAQVVYERNYEHFISCTASPSTPLDSNAYPFDKTLTGWSDLDWEPDGAVRCHYAAQVFTNAKGEWVRVTGLCDLDNDNVTATWMLDVDPYATSTSSQNNVIRPNSTTLTKNLY